MTKKNLDELIINLSKDHSKVIPLNPTIFLIKTSFPLFGVIMVLLNLKDSLIFRLNPSQFYLTILPPILFFISIGLLAVNSLTPSKDLSKFKKISIITLLIYLISLFYFSYIENIERVTPRSFCELEAISISILSLFFSKLSLKRFEFKKYEKSAHLLNFTFSFSAILILQLFCDLHIEHAFLCHIIPAMIVPGLFLIRDIKETN